METTQSKAQLYLDLLAEEGYRPSLDEDGDVRFKREGRLYYLWANQEDRMFFRLGALWLWPVESPDERARALELANEINHSTKVVKVTVTDDNLWATVELLFADPADAKGIIERALDLLDYVVREIVTRMREHQTTGAAQA